MPEPVTITITGLDAFGVDTPSPELLARAMCNAVDATQRARHQAATNNQQSPTFAATLAACQEQRAAFVAQKPLVSVELA